MVSVVRIEPNAVGAIHSHPQEQWGLMLEGNAVTFKMVKKLKSKKAIFGLVPAALSTA